MTDELDSPGTVTCDGCPQQWESTFGEFWKTSRYCRGRWHDAIRHGNPECTTVGGFLSFEIQPKQTTRRK